MTFPHFQNCFHLSAMPQRRCVPVVPRISWFDDEAAYWSTTEPRSGRGYVKIRKGTYGSLQVRKADPVPASSLKATQVRLGD